MEIEQMRIRMGEMAAEIERLQSVIDEANAQEPKWHVENGTKELFSPSEHNFLLSAGAFMPEEFSPLYARPIPAQQAVDRDTIINVLLSIGNMSEGIIADAIISAIGVQQSPAVAVPDYKEDLFQLRQKAENWSTKLGLITSVINSRKISLYAKEREFPHLLIERLHTDSEILKQRRESPRITEHPETILSNASQWSERITEQDAREIVTAWVKHLDDHDETVAIPDFEWAHHEWKLILRALLNKLNFSNYIPN